MDEVQIFREMFSETYLPRSFLEQQWHALKDSDSAVPTGAAGGKGSFLFHAQPTKKKKKPNIILLQLTGQVSSITINQSSPRL